MARNTTTNLDANPQADGFKLGGGTTKRTVTFTGADMTLTGSGTNVFTMPGATSTLLGISATATAGSIIFAGTTLMEEDNANLFWDNTNNTFGVGTTRTGAISGTNPSLRVKGTGTTSATSSFEVQNSSAGVLFFVRNDGLINFGTKGTYTESTGQLALSTSGSGAGILLGGDTQLYRSAADTLRTPDSMTVDGTLTASGAVNITGGLLQSTYASFPQIQVSSTQHAAIYLDRGGTSYTTQFRFLSAGNQKWRFGCTSSGDDLIYSYYNGSSYIDALRLVHNTGQVLIPVQSVGAGLVIGIDVNLYRSAADTLKTDDSLVVARALNTGVVTLSDGATPALDASLGNTFLLTAAGDRTIAVPTNPTSGQKITIVHKASGGARTLSLNTGAGGFRFGTDITALTSTTSGLTDYIGAIYNAADSKWDVVSYVKGFA